MASDPRAIPPLSEEEYLTHVWYEVVSEDLKFTPCLGTYVRGTLLQSFCRLKNICDQIFYSLNFIRFFPLPRGGRGRETPRFCRITDGKLATIRYSGPKLWNFILRIIRSSLTYCQLLRQIFSNLTLTFRLTSSNGICKW